MSGKINKRLILRFRDLVTEDNETIDKHKKILDEKKDYVWWAWWKKGHELTPIEEFGAFAALAKEQPIEVFLVDSGQRKIYKAICNDIESYSQNAKISPEPDRTPDYYNSTSYFAWFKFSSIEECSEEELYNYSYIELKGLFREGTSDYSKFWNKRVCSIEELVSQDRTVWCVRDFQEGDSENEIILLNANVTKPNHFSENFYETKTNSLLWLSDLHFGNSDFPKKAEITKRTLAKHIQDCCETAGLFEDIGGMIITGDITDSAKAEGYNVARSFVQDMNRELNRKLDSENIIFCPGNHDFKRKESCLERKSSPEDIVNGEFSEDYSKFYKDIYKISPNKYFSSGRKLLLASGKTIEIAALNSSILQQYENFTGHGYISKAQLGYVEQEMGWNKKDTSAIRIVIMHHHYLPTCFEEQIEAGKASSTVYDADRLMQWLIKNNVKLLLHGHKHKSFVSKVSYPVNPCTNIGMTDLQDIYVVGMGGTGVKSVDNKFATITFEKDNICINFYRIHSDNIEKDSIEQSITIPLE